MTRALVVFHGFGAWRWQRFLKPGFRHVFCAVDDGTAWIAVDSRAGLPVLRYLGPSGFDVAAAFRAQGFTVLPWSAAPRRPPPLAAASCVGLTKAVLGIRSMALTPWQLHSVLTRDRK